MVRSALLTATEIGMLAYWVAAALVCIGVLSISPELMYSDYRNALVVAWNWSFLPIDVLFAVLGLWARFGHLDARRRAVISTIALSLMFCAGAMAISYWAINLQFDAFWWTANLWLMLLSGLELSKRLGAIHG
ncbi:MAG: DUF5360 family protein [Devosia sp.]